MPTDAPSAASASARFAAVVLLPTPPLPDATAMMFLTFGSSFTPRWTACATTCDETSTSTSPTPLTCRSASATSARIASNCDFAG